MLHLHHFANISIMPNGDGPMPIYDGCDYYIPAFHSVVLVPCNSNDPEHQTPSMSSCLLLTRTGMQTAEKSHLLIMYLIDNTSNVGLLLRHGDVLGAYYTGPHAHVKAERAYMLIGNYNLLLEDLNRYWSDVETNVEEYFIEERLHTMDEDDELTLEEADNP